MNPAFAVFSNSYRAALRAHLGQGGKVPGPLGMIRLGRRAVAAGLRTLDLACLHEQVLHSEILSDAPARGRPAMIRRAASFFSSVLVPDPEVLASHAQSLSHERLTARTRLGVEVAKRKSAEKSLRASEAHHAKSLAEADFLKERLQALSHQVLRMQEDERKKISRDLHDVIAQSLMSINVRLATLRKQAGLNTRDFRRNIASTQRLLEKTALVVHRFASALRPPVLDDLGLVPALRSFMKDFTLRTAVPADLKVCSGAEKLAPARRTALFRVAQEALTNVERHSAASSVTVAIRQTAGSIVMTITDNGRGFSVRKVLLTRGNRHLGLLGMQERVEMVGGTFLIESTRGRGTSVTVAMPTGRLKKQPLTS